MQEIKVRVSFIATIVTDDPDLTGFDYMDELDFKLPDTKNFKVKDCKFDIGNEVEVKGDNK